jgi:hypothetical protein
MRVAITMPTPVRGHVAAERPAVAADAQRLRLGQRRGGRQRRRLAGGAALAMPGASASELASSIDLAFSRSISSS